MRIPRPKFVPFFTIGFLVLFLVLLIVPPRVALMQTDGEEWYIAEYAKMVGIPYEEAERRLAIQSEMSELQRRILESEPDHVASWLLHTPEFGLVVGFIVPNGDEILQKYLEGIDWAHLVKAQQVKYTLDELNALQRQVMEIARAADIPFNSGENIPDGKVTLSTTFPDELRARLEAMDAMQPYLVDVEYVYVDALAAPAEPPDAAEPGDPYYYLMVWSGTGPTCTMYKRPVNDDGTLGSAPGTSCPSGYSAPGSGTVQAYNAYVLGQYWNEGMWQNDTAYRRAIPLNNNGTVNWAAAPTWTSCPTCPGPTPLAQDGKVVGNHYYINVFRTGSCTEYKYQITPEGGIGSLVSSGTCRTTTPGSGSVQSYNNYVIAETWREGMWKSNGTSFTRTTTPLNSTNTDINYGAAPAWTQCTTCPPPAPDSQGGDIITHLP